MEGIQKTEKPIPPEEFFTNKIDLHRVTKEDFLKRTSQRNPGMDEAKMLLAKAVNMRDGDKIVILLRTDVIPPKYMPYLETHEKWEAYVAHKDGYNLWQKSKREYKKDNAIDGNFSEEEFKKYLGEIRVYNYDFRHEYAVYKEYGQAMQEGKLDEYHAWFINSRKEQEPTADEKYLKLIENDISIRESIYKKLTEGEKHSFLRKQE